LSLEQVVFASNRVIRMVRRWEKNIGIQQKGYFMKDVEGADY